MAESNELAIPGVGELIKHEDSEFAMIMAKGQTYLPRIQLGGGSSTIVKEGKLPMGHWGLINGDSVKDLGAEVDCLVLAWQWKAMDTSIDPPVSVLDHKSDAFAAIRDKSEIKDSGCMWGPEFLVYLPEEEVFAGLFMASKTARRESQNIHALVGKAATLKAKFIKKPKYSWHGPVITPCSAAFDVPNATDIGEAVKKFQAVIQTNTEVVDTPVEGDRAR